VCLRLFGEYVIDGDGDRAKGKRTEDDHDSQQQGDPYHW
jgi:hypothetical protein